MAVNPHVAVCGRVYMQVLGDDFIDTGAYIYHISYEDCWDGVATWLCVLVWG